MTVQDSFSMVTAGHAVTIRAVRKEDTDLEADFVKNLSAETKHYRFFGAVKELTSADLKRYCDLDGTRCMAFIATILQDGREIQVGVGRFVPAERPEAREVALTVADDWRHQGLEAVLLKELVKYAVAHGVKQLFSVDLSDDSVMRDLGRQFAISTARDPNDSHQVIHTLNL